MISRELLGVIAIIIAMLSDLFYVVTIFKGRTKPHVFTWIIWCLIASIVFIAQISNNAGPGAWVTGFSALCYLAIFILALFKGEKHITKIDKLCFIAALFTIPIWALTKTPVYSIIMIVIVEIFGFVPTVKKSFRKPYEEPVLTYTITGLKHIVALMALKHFSFVTALYPLILILVNGGFVGLLLWRRSVLKNKK